jgi:transcriptional regulator with XRE-family HTH domain
MDLKAVLGANLKHYRRERHLSQEELSEKVDISVKHLSAIERGLTFVSADLLEKVTQCLGVSAAVLFCKNNEKICNSNEEMKSISDENVINTVDKIAEKHLNKAFEGIKADMRRIMKER